MTQKANKFSKSYFNFYSFVTFYKEGENYLKWTLLRACLLTSECSLSLFAVSQPTMNVDENDDSDWIKKKMKRMRRKVFFENKKKSTGSPHLFAHFFLIQFSRRSYFKGFFYVVLYPLSLNWLRKMTVKLISFCQSKK